GLCLGARNDDRPAPAAADDPAPPAARADPDGEPLPEGALARLGTRRWRHDSPAFFVGFARQGRQLITARSGATSWCASCHLHPFEETTIELPERVKGICGVWDVGTGREVGQFGPRLRQAKVDLVRGQDGNIVL